MDFKPHVPAKVVLNAVVKASFGNVYDRLRSRVACLVMLAVCLVWTQTARCRRLMEKPDFRGA